jgi:hypothetical protein
VVKEQAPCRVRLDRLIFGATGRMPSELPKIAGFRVVGDFRPHRQGKIAAYGRVRKFRGVGSFSLIVLQYAPLLPWLKYPWRITIIGDDWSGVTPEDIEAVIVHCASHQISLAELAFDFAPGAGVDREFVLRHGVFGKSRRQPNLPGRDYLRYGTRTSPKLVRCYPKGQLNRYRVELEIHSQLLRRHSVSRLQHLGSFASQLCPNHVRFVDFNWNTLRCHLARRFGPAGRGIYEDTRRRADRSLRLATHYLSDRGVPNTRRFLLPLRIDSEIQSALSNWALRFPGSEAARNE